MPGWFVYMLRCGDGSLYTGIARDVQKRVDEHNGDNATAAKYTRSRRPVKLVYQERLSSRSSALKREWVIKQLTRAQKEALLGED